MNGKQGMGGWLMVYNFFSFFLVGGQHDGMGKNDVTCSSGGE